MKATLAGLLAILCAPAVLAVQLLDQAYVVDDPDVYGPFGSRNNPGMDLVQTVTAGLSGRLTRVEVQTPLFVPFDEFRILETIGGIPTDTILGTGTYAGYANGWESYLFDIEIIAGQMFAIDPFGVEPITYISWAGTKADGYAGGEARFQFDAVPEAADLGFRTFVTVPDAIPEPAAWAMMVAGFGAVGAALRYRRKARIRFR